MLRHATVALVIGALIFGCAEPGEGDVRKANVFFKNGELAAAEEGYTRALRSAPDHVAALEGLGSVAFERGEYASAITWYERALTKHVQAITVRHKLAVALSSAGDTERAIEVLERTVEIAPDDAFAHHALGGLHDKGGRIEDAKRAYVAALAADDEYHAARYALAKLELDQGRREAAEEHLTRLKAQGADRLADYGFARLAAAAGRYAEAARHLASVVEGGVSFPEKVFEDPIFREGWSTPEMQAIERTLKAATEAAAASK